MKPESEEVLSLLVDGEPVDPGALATALAEPDAAATLIEYARVHRAVLDDAAQPGDAFYRRMRAELGTARRRAIAWRTPLAAAALVVLSVLGGTWFGWSLAPVQTVPMPMAVRTPSVPSPGAPVALPQFTPAAVSPGCPAPGPPKPDRVVQFQLGVDWRPGAAAGGNRP